MPSAKKADIWVSAVLYIALGMILITLILGAGVPLIKKIGDRNVVAQTRQMLLVLDSNIRAVSQEGPGAKRFLSPVEIQKGGLFIYPTDQAIHWNMTTTADIFEPGVEFQEGPLTTLLQRTPTKGEFILGLTLDYTNTVNLTLESVYASPLQGRYSITLLHTGAYTAQGVPVVSLSVT